MKKISILLCIITSITFWGQSENYTIKNINANKKFQDFGVAYYGDSTAVFASSGKSIFMKRVWSGNHEPFLSLYQATVLENGEFTNVRQFGGRLDTKYHESNLTFTKDLKTVYFSRNNYYHKKYRTDSVGVNLIQIYKAKINENGKWENIERLPFNSDQYHTGHPTLNKNENKLYFVSNMPGSFGETDIYVVDINIDGTYGEPVNLGSDVNTTKKEMFPFIDENDVLYFSSNGFKNNNGNLDIYATKLNSKNKYFTPVNLNFPINSNKDDFAFVKKPGTNKGHFSSNRLGGKGDDDIYSFTEKKPIHFNCPETIKGVVINSKNKKVLVATEVNLYFKNKRIASTLTDNQGQYQFNIQCKSNYLITANKNHFNPIEKSFVSKDESEIEINLELTPEENEHFLKVRDLVMLNIEPIYYDLNKASIKLISEIELQKVVNIMNTYPKIIIQIRAHTDSQGRKKYNQILSEKRAKSAYNWIINKGIDKNRLLSIGYGESKLINECKDGIKCSKLKHQENRRTEFVILNPSIVGH